MEIPRCVVPVVFYIGLHCIPYSSNGFLSHSSYSKRFLSLPFYIGIFSLCSQGLGEHRRDVGAGNTGAGNEPQLQVIGKEKLRERERKRSENFSNKNIHAYIHIKRPSIINISLA
jgi:hypothetical protein